MITVYTRPGCGSCDAIKVWLARSGIEYEQIDIESDEVARAHIEELGYRSVPVVVAGHEHWSGFRMEKLAALKTHHP